MQIRIAGKTAESIVDGPGIRYTLYVQGCPHHCEGCHNPQTHDFLGGYDADTDEILKDILENPLLDGVTFSGGEPFCHAKALAQLGKKIKSSGLGIMAYSGYTIEYLISHANQENCYMDLLSVLDYLVDGPFIISLKSYEAKFRGSTNQRIIDVKKTLESKTVVIADL
ncbi:MAG: anaerobic ribonucleoside-triphosphate reductase activating protein [Oscillospiraceae bacterium]|nr:anaerobic ribonucleoside-triphosphate reductase activating protein [Oscillospiraceae bacterium]